MSIILKIFIALFLLVPIIGEAATVYVCDTSVCGNTPTSPYDTWAKALDDLPTALTRGNTYYVADGAYAAHRFNDAGTDLITIKKATVADHGTATGWEDTFGDGQAVFAPQFYFCEGNYVIDGQVGGGSGSWDSGHGFKLYSATEQIYGMIILGDKYGYCMPRNDISDVTIKHMEIASDDVNGTDYSGAIAVGSTTIPNITLSHLYIHHANRIRIQTLGTVSSNWTVEDSFFSGGYADTTHHFANIRIERGDNWTIRNNLFVDWVSTGCIGNYLTANDVKIYGNTFVNTLAHGPLKTDLTIYTNSSATSTTNWKIYNNTFINMYNPKVIDFDAGTVTGNTAYNNIFYLTNGTPGRLGVTSDYNWFYPAITSGEANSVNGTGDPFEGWETNNFLLTAPTTTGKSDLGSPYNIDPAGNIRGADAVWDRGSYEYTGIAVPDTTAPTITSVIIGPTGGILSIIYDEVVTVNNSTGFTLTMSGGAAGLEYVSGSGSATLIYNITGRLIDGTAPDAETGTLDYVTVTNGIEDQSGNDLASTGESDEAVTNNSTYSPTVTNYTVSPSVLPGCYISPVAHQVIATSGTTQFTCTSDDNYLCVAWTGTCGGTGTTTLTTSAIIADCTVIQPCFKIAADHSIGTGAAMTVGSGAAITIY